MAEPVEITFKVKKGGATSLTKLTGYVKAMDAGSNLIFDAKDEPAYTYYATSSTGSTVPVVVAKGTAKVVTAGSGVVDPLYMGRMLGDVTGPVTVDGSPVSVFDIGDVLLTRQAAVGASLDSIGAHVADFDYNGVIQFADAYKALQLLVGQYAFMMPEAPDQKPGSAKIRLVLLNKREEPVISDVVVKLAIANSTIKVVDSNLADLPEPAADDDGIPYYSTTPDSDGGYSIWVTGVPGREYPITLLARVDVMGADHTTVAATHRVKLVSEPVTIIGEQGNCPDGAKSIDGKCACDNPGMTITSGACSCSGGRSPNAANSACLCPAGQLWNGASCMNAADCVAPRSVDGNSCKCPDGSVWDGENAICVTWMTCDAGESFDPITQSCNVAGTGPGEGPGNGVGNNAGDSGVEELYPYAFPNSGGGGCSCTMCYR